MSYTLDPRYWSALPQPPSPEEAERRAWHPRGPLDRATTERLRWRVDPFGGRAHCVVPAFYDWEMRGGVRLWVTVAVWVGNRLGPWCAARGGVRCGVN